MELSVPSSCVKVSTSSNVWIEWQQQKMIEDRQLGAQIAGRRENVSFGGLIIIFCPTKVLVFSVLIP